MPLGLPAGCGVGSRKRQKYLGNNANGGLERRQTEGSNGVSVSRAAAVGGAERAVDRVLRFPRRSGTRETGGPENGLRMFSQQTLSNIGRGRCCRVPRHGRLIGTSRALGAGRARVTFISWRVLAPSGQRRARMADGARSLKPSRRCIQYIGHKRTLRETLFPSASFPSASPPLASLSRGI